MMRPTQQPTPMEIIHSSEVLCVCLCVHYYSGCDVVRSPWRACEEVIRFVHGRQALQNMMLITITILVVYIHPPPRVQMIQVVRIPRSPAGHRYG